MNKNVSETARIINSKLQNDINIFRNVMIRDTQCGYNVSVGDDTTIERSMLGNNVIINRRCYINDSIIGDYSYAGINTTVNFARIGKFCSIARNVDIGGFDHDYSKLSTLPLFRFCQMNEGWVVPDESDDLCEIGNDVWIAAGVNILHKAHISDGAVIGAGAVVTKDIPPYAIAVGNPARIIKYRFNEHIISKLLDIKWWEWPADVIKDNENIIFRTHIDRYMIEKITEINHKVKNKCITSA